MGYYLAIKNNEFMKFINKWMELEAIILSELTLSPKNTQGILKWGNVNGWEASKEMFKSLSHQGNANQNNPEITLHNSENG